MAQVSRFDARPRAFKVAILNSAASDCSTERHSEDDANKERSTVVVDGVWLTSAMRMSILPIGRVLAKGRQRAGYSKLNYNYGGPFHIRFDR